jgi:hypothetical protein
MANAPIGIVLGAKVVVAVVPDASGVRILEEPIADQSRVGDAVRSLVLKGGLRGRQAIAALPTRLCATGIRTFLSSMTLRDRIAHIRLAPDDARFAGSASDERSVVAAPIDADRSLIGVATQQTLEQFVEWLKDGGLRPYRLFSEAVGWKEALGDRYDGVVLPDVRSGTVILFHGDYPQSEFFSTNERGTWYDHAATWVGKLRGDSKGTLVMRKIALSEPQTEPMTRAIRERLQCDVLEVPELRNPVTGEKEAAPSWLLPYGLARVTDDPLDFLRALSQYRMSRFFEDRRQQFTFVSSSVALAAAIVVVLRAMDLAGYQSILAQTTVAEAQLQQADKLVAAQELNVGGIYGNLDAYLPALLAARSAGIVDARCFARFGNLVGHNAWIENFQVGQPATDAAAAASQGQAVQPSTDPTSPCVYGVDVDTLSTTLKDPASFAALLANNGIDARLTSVNDKTDAPGVIELTFGTLAASGGTH